MVVKIWNPPKKCKLVNCSFPPFFINLILGQVRCKFIPSDYRRGDWPNSLDCTDLNQCGVRRDAELCRLCYKQTNRLQAFPDFCGFNFRDIWFNAVYNSILFSSLLVLLSNLDLRGFHFPRFSLSVFLCAPQWQCKSRNACIMEAH